MMKLPNLIIDSATGAAGDLALAQEVNPPVPTTEPSESSLPAPAGTAIALFPAVFHQYPSLPPELRRVVLKNAFNDNMPESRVILLRATDQGGGSQHPDIKAWKIACYNPIGINRMLNIDQETRAIAFEDYGLLTPTANGAEAVRVRFDLDTIMLDIENSEITPLEFVTGIPKDERALIQKLAIRRHRRWKGIKEWRSVARAIWRLNNIKQLIIISNVVIMNVTTTADNDPRNDDPDFEDHFGVDSVGAGWRYSSRMNGLAYFLGLLKRMERDWPGWKQPEICFGSDDEGMVGQWYGEIPVVTDVEAVRLADN